MRTTVRVVFDDLEVARLEGTISLVASVVVDITVWVHQLEREALHSGITQAFTIARSHYVDSIDLETMSLGFTPSYEASELDEIEKAVALVAQNLADKVEDSSPPEGIVSQLGWVNSDERHCNLWTIADPYAL